MLAKQKVIKEDTDQTGFTVVDHGVMGGSSNAKVTHYETAGEMSDGYHTFDELYDHRVALFVAFAQSNPDLAWRSKQHEVRGDPMPEGWFIAGMHLETGDISYHLPVAAWDRLESVKECENAPKWDGHSPADVVTRLNDFSAQMAMENAEA